MVERARDWDPREMEESPPRVARRQRPPRGITPHNTRVETDEDGFTTVIFHSTPVVRFNDQWIVLNSGGWQTFTTKKRMNEASRVYLLGYGVYQEGGDWYVSYAGREIKFTDGMVLNRV